MSVETVESPVAATVETVPRWLVPVFAFLAGVALMYGVMKPINSTPDYQRGHADGYHLGYREGQVSMGASAPEHGVK